MSRLDFDESFSLSRRGRKITLRAIMRTADMLLKLEPPDPDKTIYNFCK